MALLKENDYRGRKQKCLPSAYYSSLRLARKS